MTVCRQSRPSKLAFIATETLDQCVSWIDSHHDLISFALTCRILKALIIPRHSQYRFIRMHHQTPHIWAHLARRKDLSMNVRAVHLHDVTLLKSPDILPSTLVDDCLDGSAKHREEDQRINNMCLALQNMDSMTHFAWSRHAYPYPRLTATTTALGDNLFRFLCQCSSLTHLTLLGDFGEGQHPETSFDCIWNISNLRSISLAGPAWIKSSNAFHIYAMLKASPNLESLTLPMEVLCLSELRFPALRKCVLFTESELSSTPCIDESRVRFIEAHPTIEELTYFPIRDRTLSPGSLPALKRLKTTPNMTYSILSDCTVPRRTIEALEWLVLEERTMEVFHNIHSEKLWKLHIASFGSLDILGRLGNLLPGVTWLHVPPPTSKDYSIDEWLFALSHFPRLEILRGGGLWSSPSTRDSIHLRDAISKLTRLCPNLQQIDHWSFDQCFENRRVLITKNPEDVSWDIEDHPVLIWGDSVSQPY